jgi:putative membrane protein
MTSTFIHKLKNSKEIYLIGILVIFYTVGTVGILMPEHTSYFLSLSFFNLLLSFSILLIGRNSKSGQFIFFLILCYVTGMSVELIGTKTGLLFGNYAYGNNLGTKVSGVPLVIGVNWGILVVTSASIVNYLKTSILFKIIASALLMTLLDVLMEPVAVESDFWNWTDGNIPFYNFVCWFLISLPLQGIYFKFKLVESNKVFDALFIILTVFFTLLNIF